LFSDYNVAVLDTQFNRTSLLKKDTQICSLGYCHEHLGVPGNLVMHFEPYTSYSVEQNEMVIDGEWVMTLKDAVLKFCSKTVRLETRKSLRVYKALSSYEDMCQEIRASGT
jgi:hypothetical protein